jgi:DNA-binding MarR family transcriptional regulator
MHIHQIIDRLFHVYSSLPSGTDPCACTTVKKLSRVLGRIYDAKISAAGINITQLAVLRVIARRSGEPLIRIAEELEMDRTSLYRAITPMIREEWLVSEDGEDARSRTARLTKKGRRFLADANKRWNGVQHQVIGRFGRNEYASLLSELNRLADCADGTE